MLQAVAEEGGQQGKGEAAQGVVQEAVEVVGDQPGRDQRGEPDVVHLVKGKARADRGGRLQPVHDLDHDVLPGGESSGLKGSVRRL
jgi:hypothetical protein